MLEIGSYAGDSAQIFWMFFGDVTCIDPHNWFMAPHTSLGEVEEQFAANTQWRGIKHIKKFSHEVFARDDLMSLLPPWVSCVYIDADHSYAATKRDIINSWSLIRENGFICGHDYGVVTPEAILSKQDGVKQAVDELFGEPDKYYIDTSWVVQKTKDRKLNLI
jgi:hypothetical protein